jgi:hypothetical protein
VPGTLHRYAYAANNPVNLTDPSGLMLNIPTNLFGNGGLLYPPQPGAPQYDLTGRADGLRGIVDAANQLSRQLSQGARSPECGSTSVLGDFWQSLQRGTLGPDLVRWGLNEYRTNPLWQRQFTDAELRQLTIDLAKRGEFEITRLLHQIVDEKGLQHWLTGQVDYAVHALRDPHMYPVLAFNLGVGLIATGIGAASLPAIAAVGIGSLVANVAFQTWMESGGGLNFNLEAFRSSLGINSAATVPGLIGGMIGARFGPWGRILGNIAGAVGGQLLTNKLMGRDWDEGLLLNMGLSVGTEAIMGAAEHLAGKLEVGWAKRTWEDPNASVADLLQTRQILREGGLEGLLSDSGTLPQVLQNDPVLAARVLGNIPERVAEAIIANLEGDRSIAIQAMKEAALTYDNELPYKHIELKNQKSNAQGFLVDKGVTYISDPDIMAIVENGRIVSDRAALELVKEMNESARGRPIIDELAKQRGLLKVEPTDPFQHSQRATYWQTSDSAGHRNIANEMPRGVVIFELDPNTRRPLVYYREDTTAWIRQRTYAENTRWYPWASAQPGKSSEWSWNNWYHFVGQRR